MKATKIILAAAALLFAACRKEDAAIRLRLFSENMAAVGGTKVLVNPATPSGASWVAGESISLNGTPYPVAYDEDAYYLNTGTDDIPSSLLAVYPSDTDAEGNDVTVTNNGVAGTVTIRSLCVDYREGGHRILFPMAAANSQGDSRLLFNHLTAGMRLTLTDTSATKDYLVGSVRIVTYGESATAAALPAVNGVSCRWAVQGPSVPGGMMGGETGDVSMAYSSEMHFTITNDGYPGKAIPKSGSISLCVPVTVDHIKTIEVTGYDTDGRQLFSRTKTLDDELEVALNYIYTIPQIKF